MRVERPNMEVCRASDSIALATTFIFFGADTVTCFLFSPLLPLSSLGCCCCCCCFWLRETGERTEVEAEKSECIICLEEKEDDKEEDEEEKEEEGFSKISSQLLSSPSSSPSSTTPGFSNFIFAFEANTSLEGDFLFLWGEVGDSPDFSLFVLGRYEDSGTGAGRATRRFLRGRGVRKFQAERLMSGGLRAMPVEQAMHVQSSRASRAECLPSLITRFRQGEQYERGHPAHRMSSEGVSEHRLQISSFTY